MSSLLFAHTEIEKKKNLVKINVPKVTCIDFETFGIQSRPSYPPVPTSLSIKQFGKKSKYYAWGHVPFTREKRPKTEWVNNCTKAEAMAALKAVWDNPDGLLCHNTKFDLDCAEVHFGLKMPSWDRIHETMFLLFLLDPNQRRMDLKGAAARILNWPPDEQDAVKDWLVGYQPVEGVKISGASSGKEPYGKYIAYCPGAVVGPYANGDVDRTEALFVHCYTQIAQPRDGYPRGMLDAYDRERRVNPILLDMERRGVRVDPDRLKADITKYEPVMEAVSQWIITRIKAKPDINLDSDVSLIAALVKAKLLDTSKMGRTKTKKVKADKLSMEAGLKDKQVAAMLRYRGALSTCINTHMRSWLETAKRSKGLIFTHWNQTRGEGGGARTGRLSSTPPLQNIPKEFGVLFRHEAVEYNRRCKDPKDLIPDVTRFPECPIELPFLPRVRGYIIPSAKGDVLIGRDYSQQEPRILAHFEGGALMAQYQNNPWIDYHDNAQANLEQMFARRFVRKTVKIINLGIIFGQGAPSIAVRIGEPLESVVQLKQGIMMLYPGLDHMYKDMRQRAKNGESVTTWGGREFYCEPPAFRELVDFEGEVDKKWMTFDYKMVNTLIQGSAADCTKEAMVRVVVNMCAYATPTEKRRHKCEIERGLAVMRRMGWQLIIQVHDELVMSVPKADLARAQEHMREAMESIGFAVIMKSEGSYSNDNWNDMRPFDIRGERVG